MKPVPPITKTRIDIDLWSCGHFPDANGTYVLGDAVGSLARPTNGRSSGRILL